MTYSSLTWARECTRVTFARIACVLNINPSTECKYPKIGSLKKQCQDKGLAEQVVDTLKSSLRMPVTFQGSADISTELVLNIQSTLYRYKFYVKELKSFYQFAEQRIKKKRTDDNDPHTSWSAFFQPNLTNEGSKARQEDPLLFRPGGTSHTEL